MDGLLKITSKPGAEELSTGSPYNFEIDGKIINNAISKVTLTFAPDEIVTAEVTIAVGEVHVGLDGRQVHVRPDDLQIEQLNERLGLVGYEVVKKTKS